MEASEGVEVTRKCGEEGVWQGVVCLTASLMSDWMGGHCSGELWKTQKNPGMSRFCIPWAMGRALSPGLLGMCVSFLRLL